METLSCFPNMRRCSVAVLLPVLAVFCAALGRESRLSDRISALTPLERTLWGYGNAPESFVAHEEREGISTDALLDSLVGIAERHLHHCDEQPYLSLCYHAELVFQSRGYPGAIWVLKKLALAGVPSLCSKSLDALAAIPIPETIAFAESLLTNPWTLAVKRHEILTSYSVALESDSYADYPEHRERVLHFLRRLALGTRGRDRALGLSADSRLAKHDATYRTCMEREALLVWLHAGADENRLKEELAQDLRNLRAQPLTKRRQLNIDPLPVYEEE
jgi:hypothetical protein